MKDCNCGYCVGGEPLAKFGIKICDLKVSQLIPFKNRVISAVLLWLTRIMFLNW